jgi:hypothetical protein
MRDDSELSAGVLRGWRLLPSRFSERAGDLGRLGSAGGCQPVGASLSPRSRGRHRLLGASSAPGTSWTALRVLFHPAPPPAQILTICAPAVAAIHQDSQGRGGLKHHAFPAGGRRTTTYQIWMIQGHATTANHQDSRVARPPRCARRRAGRAAPRAGRTRSSASRPNAQLREHWLGRRLIHGKFGPRQAWFCRVSGSRGSAPRGFWLGPLAGRPPSPPHRGVPGGSAPRAGI